MDHASFITIDDTIFAVLDTWPPEWRGLDVVGRNETAIQKQKATAKFLAQHKWNEQLAEEVWVSREAAQAVTDKATAGGAATIEGERSPNMSVEPEMDNVMEGVEPSTTPTQLK